jgi:tRNA 2-selenouridine synthase
LTTLCRIEAGYKALRSFLLTQLEQLINKLSLVLLTGKTGTGKTQLLKQIPGAIDLESYARHRGSSFGGLLTPQPTPINFENSLIIACLKQWQAGFNTLILEDESRTIGRLSIPNLLFNAMGKSPLVLLQKPFTERVETILQDYVIDNYQLYQSHYGLAVGPQKFYEHLLFCLKRIARRLGGDRYQKIMRLMNQAIKADKKQQDFALHKAWISELLRDYYDPCYDYQLQCKQQPVLMQGDTQAVIDFLTKTKSTIIRE